VSELVLQRLNRAPRAVLPLASTAAGELSAAALQVLATVPGWWARRASEAGVSAQELSAAVAVEAPICPAVLEAVPPRRDLLDVGPAALGEAYVQALDPAVRTAGGRHYTPLPLAEVLWDQTVTALGSEPVGLVLDPACGAGALLVPAIRNFVARNTRTQPELVLASLPTAIAGRDLDPSAVWLANVVLAAEVLEVWAAVPSERRRPIPALCAAGDGLVAQEPAAQVVVMNPPYGRVRLDQAARLRHARSLYGHANIYALFMAAALDQVVAGGVVSALVPAGWLGGAYFQRLRAVLGETAPLQRLSFVSDRAGVFATGVLQETVVASFRAGAPARGIECQAISVGVEGVHTEHIGVGERPASCDQPWLLPRSSEDSPLVRAAAAMPDRLADHGWTVSTGPLVWNRMRDRLSRRPHKGSVKVLWAADMDGGVLRRHRRRDEHRYLQLRTERERGVFVLDRPAVLIQRTTSPEQPRRLVAGALDAEALAAWGGEVVVENHVNVLTCCDPSSALSTRLLVRLLDSQVLDRLYRCVTGSVAVSAYELGALPLPDAEVLASWAGLDDDALDDAIADAYGQKA